MKNSFIKYLWLFRITTIILVPLYLKGNNHLIHVAFIVSLTTWYHLEMRNLVGNYIGPRLNIRHDSKWFRQTNFEKILDAKLKVKKWKKYILSYDPNEFDLKKYSFDQIITNMYRAEIDHEIIFILSYVPILFSLFFDAFSVFFLTSFFASLTDFALVLVQRYNRNRLIKISKKVEKRN